MPAIVKEHVIRLQRIQDMFQYYAIKGGNTVVHQSMQNCFLNAFGRMIRDHIHLSQGGGRERKGRRTKR